MVSDVVEGAIGAEGDSMKQLTIFDLLQKEGFCENQIINELVDDLKQLFPDIEIKHYTVWSHVPNLGKRLWCYVEEYPVELDVEWLIQKYMAKSLEISISVTPDMEDDGFNAYISTLWKTKGHKEI